MERHCVRRHAVHAALRLRQAREAVKTDSKQVAQVVKDWVANDE